MANLQTEPGRARRLAHLLIVAIGAAAFVLFGSVDYAWPSASSSVHCTVPDTGGAVILVCTNPAGAVLPTVGTTTSGIEETLRYACDNNLSYYVDGSTSGGLGGSFLNLSTTLDMRSLRNSGGANHAACPIQGKTIRFDYVTLNWSTAAMASPAWIWDSFMDLDFYFSGQPVYPGIGCLLHFVPTNGVPVDGFITQTASHFVMNLVAGQTTAPFTNECLIKFDNQYGPTIQNRFDFIELNGGGCPSCTSKANIGIVLINTANHGFIQNRVTAQTMHGTAVTGLALGQSAADGAAIWGNIWSVGFSPFAIGFVAVDTWGADEFHGSISKQEMPALSDNFTGVHLRPGATEANNIFLFTRIDARVKVIDDNPVVPPLRRRVIDQFGR